MSSWVIGSINAGRAVPFRDDEASAIGKRPLFGTVAVEMLGLAGDEQADRANHGGGDMALHHYPRDHYPAWRELLGDHPLLGGQGAFGENVSVLGLDEQVAAIGDRYRLGSALVEISQGRKPCWKLAHRFGHPQVTAEVVRTGRAGWYYRVIEPGAVAAGDRLELVERPYPQWSVARVFDLIVAGGLKRDRAAAGALARLPALSDVWRERARAMARD